MVDIASLLGRWAAGTGPLYDQLALAILRLIKSGDIVVGSKLPPEREMAKSLAVSRTTIISAYAKLQEMGWLERRQGAGTWVAKQVDDAQFLLDQPTGATSYAITRVLTAAVEPAPGLIDLATAAFKDADHIHAVLQSISSDELEALGELGGYHPLGVPDLRNAVSMYLSEIGIPTGLDQIVITTGVQQAAHIIFSAYATGGWPVAVESPTWNGAHDILRMLGGVVVPLPVDDDGIVLDGVSRLARSGNLRGLWMSSGYHNPTGVRVSAERIALAARLAVETQTPIFEDMTLFEYGLTPDTEVLSVAQCEPSASVLSVGSLSKLLSPALRLGWIRAPRPVVKRIARQKTAWDNGTSLLPQIIATQLLDDRENVVESRRRKVRENLQLVESLLTTLLPDWTWNAPDGGLVMWATIPRGDAREFVQIAQREGVEVLPGSVFHWEAVKVMTLRLSLTRPLDETREGFHRLARAWGLYVGKLT